MKRKEAALNGEFEQDLPPVRSKIKRDKPVVVSKKPEKRISSSDYQSWEKFDVDKACEEIDMAEVGPVSLDSKKSQAAKQEKLREEAQYEKERGNAFVRQDKLDEAISCYSRAIELVKDDAIYFANRGLCYLKKDSLHQAETDCSEAIRLDPTYVKAFQRRATARERLGSLRAASQDLNEVLKLEPHNLAAKRQLETIKIRMGTKGLKSKCSPSSTPTIENNPMIKPKPKLQPKIIELPDEPAKTELSPLDKWREGIGERITVITPVNKPPHLRSKRPLKSIAIQEIPLSELSPKRPATRMKIIEIENNLERGDTNNNDSNKTGDAEMVDNKGKGDSSPESVKLITDIRVNEKRDCVKNMTPPLTSVQFMAEWKYLKGNDAARSDYLSVIDPSKIPTIFENALESDVLSDVLRILHQYTDKFKEKTVSAYLRGLCTVKRFSALAMFLSSSDKQVLTNLLQHCKTAENASDDEIQDLKNKYEI
ncbi:RNA polymerase II-associated protein 3-like isoform X2 [Galleria mellonella]|nr:RNA polymerase II-associated protein 3-like isoform X2 [Galleria mellonella]